MSGAVNHGAATAAVRLRGLSRGFGDKPVLRGITLDVAEGEFVALIGRSGSGKSTLLRALAVLDDDAEREGFMAVPERASVLFQDSRLLPWERVLDNVTIGFHAADAAASGLAMLRRVGLGDKGGAWPATLSGGEKQRVALARSLVRRPQLLLADEPFGALDALTRVKMHGLLFELVAQEQPTVILVTHDVDEALLLADRVLVMDEGRIALDRAVGLPHPRRASHAGFESLRSELLAALGVEVAAA